MFFNTKSSAIAAIKFLCIFLVAGILSFPSPIIAQHVTSILEHLTPQEGADLQLELDLTELINEKKKGTYFPGTLTSKQGEQFAVEVRARGKYRRMNCELPPLKLKFAKKALRNMGLDTVNEVKLVVPCFDNPESEAHLLREYAAYKIYEQLTPNCVRARLIKVTLRDSHVEKTYRPMWCLLVEHEEEVAARLGGQMVESYNMSMDSIVTEASALNTVFQYLIGNTDWDIAGFRNIYLFRPAPGAKVIPIPFDFDFSGLVNAPYASVSASTGLQTVKDRLLMKNDLSKQAIRSAVQTVCSQKTKLMELCSTPIFDAVTAQSLILYLNDFFTVAESNKDLPVMLKNVR